MSGRTESRASRHLLVVAVLAGAMLLVRTVRARGGSLRLASPLPHRRSRHPIEERRLCTRHRRRLGAHLTRLADSRRAVLALPWDDFEHLARLAAAWRPLRSVSAGL